MRGSRLVIPACLAVSALQLGCPSDPSPTDSSTTGDAATSTTDPGPTTTSSTSTTDSTSTSATADTTNDTGDTTLASSESSATSTDESSGPDTGTGDTGSGLPDCNAIEDPKTCDAIPGCLYDVVVGQCDVDCTLIEDMAICVEQTGVCYWLDGACYHVAI